MDHATVSTPRDDTEELFVLRIKRSGVDLLGFRNEVLIFRQREEGEAVSLTMTLFGEEKKQK